MFDPKNPYLNYITTSGGLAQLTLSDAPTETVITTSGGTFPAILALDPSDTSAVVTEGVSFEDGGTAVYAYLQPLVPNAVPTLLSTYASAGNFYAFFTADGADLVTEASGSVSTWPTAAPAPTPLLSGVNLSVVLTGSNFFALTSSASPMTGLIVNATGKTAPWAFAPDFSGYAVVNDGAAIVYATTSFPWGLYVLSVP